ncbi:sugar phosphate isomerase/epimerase family protein [Candidatus Hydrogenedentota bacterium]
MKLGCQIGSIQGTTEEAGELLQQLGIVGLEVFSSRFNPYYDKKEDLIALLDRYGIQISGAYFGHNGLVLAEEKESALEAGYRVIDFLAEINGGFLVVNGGISNRERPDGYTERDFEQFGEVLNSLGKHGAEKNVGVVVHPHIDQTVVTCEELERLLPYLDTSNVGLCLHAAHQYFADVDPYEMYEKYAHLVRYLHIGETGADKEGELLGEGELDQDRLMKRILGSGYDGWLIMESSKEGVAPADYIEHGSNYIRSKSWA